MPSCKTIAPSSLPLAKYNGLQNKNKIYSSFNRQAEAPPKVFQGRSLIEAVAASEQTFTIPWIPILGQMKGREHKRLCVHFYGSGLVVA